MTVDGHVAEELEELDRVIDLEAIAARRQVRRVRIPSDWRILTGSLSVGDVADMAEAAGVGALEAAQAIDEGGPGGSLELALALAWVILRREVDGLTYAEFRAGYMIEGGPPDPRPARRPRRAAGPRSNGRRGSSGSPA